MAKELAESLRFRPWPPGDPWVLVETILQIEEDDDKRDQIVSLGLQAAATQLQANLTFVQGLQKLVSGGR